MSESFLCFIFCMHLALRHQCISNSINFELGSTVQYITCPSHALELLAVIYNDLRIAKT